jgi:CubicO group peptidase (beta-lactamase class C family)
LVPLAGPFRETYHYSNYGLTEAAIAATLDTRKTWEQIAEQQLYSKIGMLSTSSRYSDYVNNPNKAALHYLVRDGVYINWFVREADAESPAGGVNSNVRDLAKWVELQLAGGDFNGRQVVDRQALEETHEPQIPTIISMVSAGMSATTPRAGYNSAIAGLSFWAPAPPYICCRANRSVSSLWPMARPKASRNPSA